MKRTYAFLHFVCLSLASGCGGSSEGAGADIPASDASTHDAAQVPDVAADTAMGDVATPDAEVDAGIPQCPANYPSDGDACEGEPACDYTLFDCQPPLAVSAVCTGGMWKAPQYASCALPPGSQCNPLGTWTIEHGDFDTTPMGFASSVDTFDETITTATNGALVAAPKSARLDAATCELTITDLISYTSVPPEYGGGYSKVVAEWKLVLSSGTGTGTLKVWCEGECGWTSNASATATRKAQ